MNPVVVLTDERIRVEPGGEARTTVRIRNAGARVEEYELQVLGPPAPWTEVVPPQVSVYPGTDTEVAVVFRPIRSPSTPSGSVPYGVLCRSREDPDSSAVAEGFLDIGAILEVAASLNPQESKGRWRGKHRIDVENNGSGPVRVKLIASDPANALSFALGSEVVEVPAGSVAGTSLRVRTREPAMRGQPAQRRFQVSYSRLLSAPGEAPEATKIDGIFTQKPILSKLVVGAAALALVAAVAGVALLFLGGGDEDKKSRALPIEAPAIREITTAADRAQIVWDPDPNATGYKVQLVSGPGPNPDVTDEKEPKEGQNAFSWPDLQADSEYCFRLIALNGKLTSLPSKTECKKTPPLSQAKKPILISANKQEDALRVDVTWTDDAADASHIVLIDGVKKDEVTAGKNNTTVSVDSPGTYCFSVVGKHGDSETAPSEEICVPIGPLEQALTGGGGGGASGGGGGGAGGATTPGQSTTTTAPGGGQTIEVDGWLVWLKTVLADDLNNDQLVDELQQNRAQLEQDGIANAKIALNSQIGLLQPEGELALYLYVDGFVDQAAADTFCQAHVADFPECLPQLPAAP